MSKPVLCLSLDAFDYVDARQCLPTGRKARDEFKLAKGSRSPFRNALRGKDDLGFVDELVAQLVAADIPADLVEAIAASVLLQPSIAAASGSRLLHATVFALPDSFPIRVRVSGQVDSTPYIRAVRNFVVNVLPVDLSNSADVDALAVEAAQYGLDYPMPKTVRSVRPRFSVHILGKPINGVAPVGKYTWNQLVRALERPFNVEIEIVTKQSQVKDAFPASTEVTVALDPAFVGVASKVGKVPLPTIIGSGGKSAEELAGDVAALIRKRASELEEAEPVPSKRELIPGERVFHRKVSSSAAFDKFGEPCKPCVHGEAQFVRYHAAPKAEKGMARKYSNFEPSMLHHCGTGYGCGMYAVFMPSKNP